MDKFKITTFNIEKYSELSYGGARIEKEFDNLMIYGGNSSGKSTTIDALGYAVFGTGGSRIKNHNLADTYIELKNSDYELSIKRKVGDEHFLTVKSLKDSANETETIRGIDKIDAKIKELFNINKESLEPRGKIVYQSPNDSLRKLNKSRFMELLSYYTGLYQKNYTIDENKKVLRKIEDDKGHLEIDQNRIKKEIAMLKTQNRDSEKYIGKLKNLVESYENGSMEKYFEFKKQKNEVFEQAKELSSNIKSLESKKRQKLGELGKLKSFYKQQILDLVKQTLSSLVCPVCGDNANLGKISNYYKTKKCPYCGSENYDKSLYDIIANRIDSSDEKVPEFEKEIEKITKEIDDKKAMLESIEKGEKNLELIDNPYALDYCKKYDSYQSEELKLEINEKIKELEDRKQELTKITNEIKNKTDMLESIEKEIKKLDESKTQIEKENTKLYSELEKESISVFLEKLNHYYGKLMGIKSQNIVYRKGDFLFEDTLHNDVKYLSIFDERRGNAQKRCLDFSLACAFSDLDKIYNVSNIGYIIMEDPAEGVYNDEMDEVNHKETLIEILKEKIEKDDMQIILLTADNEYTNKLKMENINIRFQMKLVVENE
ncbi:AAA family ATPase [Methanococcus sp. CF]